MKNSNTTPTITRNTSIQCVTPQIVVYGKLGTFKKIDVVIDALQQFRNEFDYELDIIVAGSDSHLASGYLEGVQKKYDGVKGIHYVGAVSKSELVQLMDNSIVVNFPYLMGGQGSIYHVSKKIEMTMAHKLNNLRDLAIEQGYKHQPFNSICQNSLVNAIAQLLVIPKLQTA